MIDTGNTTFILEIAGFHNEDEKEKSFDVFVLSPSAWQLAIVFHVRVCIHEGSTLTHSHSSLISKKIALLAMNLPRKRKHRETTAMAIKKRSPEEINM